jgi:hypothetical protein
MFMSFLRQLAGGGAGVRLQLQELAGALVVAVAHRCRCDVGHAPRLREATIEARQIGAGATVRPQVGDAQGSSREAAKMGFGRRVCALCAHADVEQVGDLVDPPEHVDGVGHLVVALLDDLLVADRERERRLLDDAAAHLDRERLRVGVLDVDAREEPQPVEVLVELEPADPGHVGGGHRRLHVVAVVEVDEPVAVREPVQDVVEGAARDLLAHPHPARHVVQHRLLLEDRCVSLDRPASVAGARGVAHLHFGDRRDGEAKRRACRVDAHASPPVVSTPAGGEGLAFGAPPTGVT